jgi:glutathione S-transferase
VQLCGDGRGKSPARILLSPASRHDPDRDHLPPFRRLAVFREDPPRVRLQAARLAIRARVADHAAARSDASYRRLPADADDADGADIFCDTRIILREIEARYPAPTLLPRGAAGMVLALGMWTDRAFFQNTVNLVFGTLADQVPRDFIEDRERLRGGKFDIAAMKAALPQMRDQFRAHVDWIETQLAAGGDWLLGDFSLADVHAYMNVWYATTRLPNGEALLRDFPLARAWAARARDIGHGAREEIGSAEALEIAARAHPTTPIAADPGDPNSRAPGDRVTVTPDDYGRIAVSGEIVSLSPQRIAIRRRDERAGEIVVHFPRAGFSIAPEG